MALAESLLGESVPSTPGVQYELDCASQGREGLDLVYAAVEEGSRYGVAFVDVRMPPGWDGVETTERLWDIDPNLQVVICTAYSDITYSEINQRIGRGDQLLVLKKPFDAIEVRQLASTLCQKRQLIEITSLRHEQMERMVESRTLELRELAESDPLTQLPNRISFLRAVEHSVLEKQAGKQCVDTVMFIDLDNFKLINDSMGHEVGDRVLLEMAKRLRENIRAGDELFSADVDMPARLGGDEFGVVIRNVRNAEDGMNVAKRVLESLEKTNSSARPRPLS